MGQNGWFWVILDHFASKSSFFAIRVHLSSVALATGLTTAKEQHPPPPHFAGFEEIMKGRPEERGSFLLKSIEVTKHAAGALVAACLAYHSCYATTTACMPVHARRCEDWQSPAT